MNTKDLADAAPATVRSLQSFASGAPECTLVPFEGSSCSEQLHVFNRSNLHNTTTTTATTTTTPAATTTTTTTTITLLL